MTPPSTFFKISEIKTKLYAEPEERIGTPLHDYQMGLDEHRRLIYINAEVRQDSLDKGSDPTDLARQCARAKGTYGDNVGQFIGKKLGGSGNPYNVFPLNPTLDTSVWKTDEDRVYEHVKQGGNRHARLMYGIEIYNEFEVMRAAKIYYHFKLYKNGEAVGQAIEGVFENKSPRLTNERFYLDAHLQLN